MARTPTVEVLISALARPAKQSAADVPLAAVAMIIDAAGDVLFMRRAAYEGDPWSGNVAFPGGRVELDDASPLDAARREVREEIGLSLSDARVLGVLDDVPTVSHLPRLAARPFVFSVDSVGPLSLNHEVASVHRVSLVSLLAGRGRGRMPFEFRGNSVELPCVDFDGQRLWGMTLRMVDDMLHRLDGGGVGFARSCAPP